MKSVSKQEKSLYNYWEYDENNTACSKVQKVIDDLVEKVSD